MPKDKQLISWITETIQAFNHCKQSLADATLLVHPREGANLALTTDASDSAMGGSVRARRCNLETTWIFLTQILTLSEKV